MAEDHEDGPEWPEVVIKKDDMKTMRFIIIVEGMEVIRSLFGPNKPKNFTAIKEEFLPGEITLQYEVQTNGGKARVWEYTKKLPADIIPVKSSVRYKKNEQMAVTLHKVKEGSWSTHARYMATRNKEKE